MSIERAANALAGVDVFATGSAWLPPDLLDRVADESGVSDRALAHATAATSLGVDLAFVDSDGDSAVAEVDALHEADIATVWAVPGVFGRICENLGWTEALRLTVADPGALAVRLDEALHEALEAARRGPLAGADALLVADELAGASGPLLPPDYALDALVPCYHRLAAEAVLSGLPALFHSDGDVRVLFPSISRAGFSAVHLAGLSPAQFAVDAAAARNAGLVVLGGLSAPAALGVSRDAGARVGAFAASLGGVIVCDDGGITTLEELAGVQVALEAARESYRRVQG